MRYLATGQKKQDRSEQDAVRLFRERESVRGSPALGCSSCSRAEATSLGGCCDRIEAAAPAPSLPPTSIRPHFGSLSRSRSLRYGVNAAAAAAARSHSTPPALPRPRPSPPSLALGRARPPPCQLSVVLRRVADANRRRPRRDAGSFKDKGFNATEYQLSEVAACR